MNTNVRSAAFLVFLGTTTVRGCSPPPPPCGVVQPGGIQLTNVTGILHIKLLKYPDCESSNSERRRDNFGVEETTIEVNVESERVRYAADLPWDAKNLGNNGFNIPYENPEYKLKFQKNSRKIIVKKFPTPKGSETTGRKKTHIFGPFSGFVAPPNPNDPQALTSVKYVAEGVISFFSRAEDRIYFVYPLHNSSGDWRGRYNIVSCSGIGNGDPCMVSEAPEKVRFDEIDIFSKAVEIYHMEQPATPYLVSLPVMCCLCVSVNYFTFEGGKIKKSVDTLNGSDFTDKALDTRTGVAYAAMMDSGARMKIKREFLSSGEATEFYIDKETLANSFL